jgi:hypothetical protein
MPALMLTFNARNLWFSSCKGCTTAACTSPASSVNLAISSSADCNRKFCAAVSSFELEEPEELEDDAATIFCRLRGGDAALPASPSLVRFLDDMILKWLQSFLDLAPELDLFWHGDDPPPPHPV